MTPTPIAVIGTGHLGRIHARLAAEAEGIELVAIVDIDAQARERVAEETGARAVADFREVMHQIEGAVVATPTIYHHAVGSELLSAGIHVLVEKPITATVEEADELVQLAEEKGLVLQVGHVERFNSGLECIADRLNDVRYMQAARTSGFTFRSTDIGVVMDLMIHDLDIVLSIADSPVKQVSAIGVSVMGGEEDIAQAQLIFENGCVAQLTASRVSYAPERSLKLFTSRGFARVDYGAKTATVVDPRIDMVGRHFDVDSLDANTRNFYREHLFEELLQKKTIEPESTNAIAEEHRNFAESIRSGSSPRVTGKAGRDALAVAQQILDSIAAHEWDGQATGRRGPLATPGDASLRRAG